MWRAAVVAAAVIMLTATSVSAQQVARGMVWAAPQGDARAEQDLHEMRDAGVTAVRTELPLNESILRAADSLGLDLYVDLSISRLPARRLVDTLGYARAVLDTALALAWDHGSIRAIGLARHSDTSDSTACAYIRALARHRRVTGPPSVRAYYVTRFVESDACSQYVDFVLADLRDVADPPAVLRRWDESGARPPLGVAALGVWVRSDSLRGLRVPASPERQARYFERYLPVLLSDTLSARPPTVFVYRWRDYRHAFAGTAYDLDQPYVERFGLHAVDGTERPALDIVRGIYAGSRSVFALDPGSAPEAPTPWQTLVGWGVLAVLGVFFALSPRFRHMVPRYFQARFFFREAVREGRDVLLGASTVLLAALAAASGLVMFVILDATRGTDAFTLAVRWLPTSTQGVITTLLARPLVLVILVGCTYVGVLLVWTVVLSFLTRRKYTVTPAQVLMLVVWPRWPLLLVMIGAMVASSLPEPNLHLIGALAAGWVLVSIAAVIRTLLDLMAVARMPFWLLPPAVLLHPALIAAGVLTVMLMGFVPEVEFVLHAAVRR